MTDICPADRPIVTIIVRGIVVETRVEGAFKVAIPPGDHQPLHLEDGDRVELRLNGDTLTVLVLDAPVGDADAIAQAFHESYERQAPLLGYETREATAVPDPWRKLANHLGAGETPAPVVPEEDYPSLCWQCRKLIDENQGEVTT